MTQIETCPCCGAPNLDRTSSTVPVLLAVCDVLVTKALETMGKWLVRTAGRREYPKLERRPFYLAHTIWPPSEEVVGKALRGAWDVVPAMLDIHGCCGATSRQVTSVLDQYVHDLVITGTPHSLPELQYRLDRYLGLGVPHAHAIVA